MIKNKLFKKFALLSAFIISFCSLGLGVSHAKHNKINADVVFTIINKNYTNFAINTQIQKREKLSSLLKSITGKIQKAETKKLISELVIKADKHIEELKEQNKKDNKKIDELTTMRNEMLDLINKERAKVGLWKLSLNEKLNKSAQLHAEYMDRTGDYNHTTKDWVAFDDRITAAGYTGLAIGENIAWNQETVKSVMNSWMNSPMHKANILNNDFSEIGIGHSKESREYRVQNFWGN